MYCFINKIYQRCRLDRICPTSISIRGMKHKVRR